MAWQARLRIILRRAMLDSASSITIAGSGLISKLCHALREFNLGIFSKPQQYNAKHSSQRTAV
jgi:hypothetical protein